MKKRGNASPFFFNGERVTIRSNESRFTERERILQRKRLIHNGGNGVKSGITRHRVFH